MPATITRIVRRGLFGLVVASVAYRVLLAYPQPLFAASVLDRSRSGRYLQYHLMVA